MTSNSIEFMNQQAALKLVANAVPQSAINRHRQAAAAAGDLEASARNFGGVILRDDFDKTIYDFRLKEISPMWLEMPKSLTGYDVVKTAQRNDYMQTGYADKSTGFLWPSAGPQVRPQADLSDPGQEVQAIVTILDIPYMEQVKLTNQEHVLGKQYDPAEYDAQEEMITSFWRFMGQELFSGDHDANPLAFNGIVKHLRTGTGNEEHEIELDLTGAEPDSIVAEIDSIISHAEDKLNMPRDLNMVITGAPGSIAIRRELEKSLLRTSVEMTGGVKYNAILANNHKEVPIIPLRWMDDVRRTGQGQFDELHFYLYDKSHWQWKGMNPLGGQWNNFNPQIFDIMSNVGASNQKPLLQQKIMIVLGTPIFLNRGRSLYRIKVKAPQGTVRIKTN